MAATTTTASKSYTGQVKAVPSGDSLVVMHRVGPQQLIEHTVSLSNIQSPRFANPQAPEEPFAWASREFLRRQCIGQMVSCIVHASNAKGREFCSVSLNGEDLAQLVVSEGWATVSPQATHAPPELLDAEESARKSKKGLHNTTAADRVTSGKMVPGPLQFFEQNHQGNKPCHCVIEQVRTGGVLRVEFLMPSKNATLAATVAVAGILAPSCRWDNTAKTIVEEEPLGAASRTWTEVHVLHREALVTLRAIDKQGNFTGIVQVLGRDLGEELLKEGLAKHMPWVGTVTELPEYCEKLRAAEQSAKSRLAGLWVSADLAASVGSVAAATAHSTAPTTAGDKVVGRVVDIPSAGVLVVKPNAPVGAANIRMALASIKAPKQIREEKGLTRRQLYENLMAFNARELLRTKLLHTPVTCHLRYERTAPPQQTGQQQPQQTANQQGQQSFWDVYVDGTLNVAKMLVKEGLLEVVPHRASDPKSHDFDSLCLEEQRAQSKKKGLFGFTDSVEIRRINDLTIDQSAHKSSQFLPFLQKDVEIECVVDYIWSASHLKCLIPSEFTLFSLNLSGARPPKQGEKYADTALEYVRSIANLHAVRVSIESVDKAGNFIGSVLIPSTANKGTVNLAVDLLSKGYAQLTEMAKRSGNRQLVSAETSAKQAKLAIWENWTPEEETEAGNASEQAASKPKTVLSVQVTDLAAEPGVFFIQTDDGAVEADVLKVELNTIAATEEQQQLGRLLKTLSAGEWVLAKFPADEMWYRGRVLKPSGANSATAVVQFVDFGSVETVQRHNNIQPLPKKYQEEPAPLAKKACLAWVMPPDLQSDFLPAFGDCFQEFTAGKRLTATVEYAEGNTLFLGLADHDLHVNVALVKEGLARVVPKAKKMATKDTLITSLIQAEQAARRSRANLWQYGDYDDVDQ